MRDQDEEKHKHKSQLTQIRDPSAKSSQSSPFIHTATVPAITIHPTPFPNHFDYRQQYNTVLFTHTETLVVVSRITSSLTPLPRHDNGPHRSLFIARCRSLNVRSSLRIVHHSLNTKNYYIIHLFFQIERKAFST